MSLKTEMKYFQDCQIAELNMNACATTMMKKAIKRVAEKWIGFDLPANTLDKIVEVVKGKLFTGDFFSKLI